MTPLEIAVPALAAVGFPAWAAFHPRSQLFGSTICRVEKGCALTFDDGPNPRVTPRLLSLLHQYNVRATFFLLGKYVRQYPALAAEIAAANHQIANHTFSHSSLVFFGRRQILDEINRCEDAIFQATGRRSVAIRPPFGFRGPQFGAAVRAAGFGRIVMWSVSGRDWKPQPAARMIGRLRKVGPGDIVLLHDGDHHVPEANREHMIQALELWLPRWIDSGLEFNLV